MITGQLDQVAAESRRTMRKEPLSDEQQLALISRMEESSALFRIIGGICIVLSFFYVLAVTLASLNGLGSIYLLSAYLSFFFSFTNGLLVLRAANNSLPLNLGWKEMTFGYGLTTFAFHCVGLVFAIVRLANCELSLSSSGKFAEVCYTALLVVFALLELMQAIQGCETRQLISAVRRWTPEQTELHFVSSTNGLSSLPSGPLPLPMPAEHISTETSPPPNYEEAILGLL